METITKTRILESGISTYMVDLVQFKPKGHYISISQATTSQDLNVTRSEIKINRMVLNELITILIDYRSELDQEEGQIYQKKINEIIRRYLIGVEIAHLSMQFNCSENTIKQILANNTIEIVSNKVPHFYFRKRKR